MELEEVELLDAQTLLAGADAVPGVLVAALAGLGAEEHLVANGRHGGRQAFHGLAIAGRHVDVIDAAAEDEIDGGVGLRLIHPAANGDGAKRDHRTHVLRAAESSGFHGFAP